MHTIRLCPVLLCIFWEFAKIHMIDLPLLGSILSLSPTVYPKKYAHGFCFAVLCCGYTLTDYPISIRLTSLALWQFNHCPSASKATLMNMDKYFMWIRYERLHNHNQAKHNKIVCIFLGIYCMQSCYCCRLLDDVKLSHSAIVVKICLFLILKWVLHWACFINSSHVHIWSTFCI